MKETVTDRQNEINLDVYTATERAWVVFIGTLLTKDRDLLSLL